MHSISVTNRSDIQDPRAADLAATAATELDIPVDAVTVLDRYWIDADISPDQLATVKDDLLVDLVTQEGYTATPDTDADWLLQIALKPGMKDTEGERTRDAIHDLLEADVDQVRTGTLYVIRGDCSRAAIEQLAAHQSNDLIHDVTVVSTDELAEDGSVLAITTGQREREPQVTTFTPDASTLEQTSAERNLSLSTDEIATIVDHFTDKQVLQEREEYGLTDELTDVELEMIAQSQSEHCKHKIFNAAITYTDAATGETDTIDSLFSTYIKGATEEIDADQVLSVFWDNAGIVDFTDEYGVAMKYETHNSPSGKEPYGGAETGIVGVYRDPMGTGKGARIIAGSYGFCTPDPFYDGDLEPEIPPKQLLDGIVSGVRDGGNKSGVPTIYGYAQHDDSYLGKPLVYVGALGLVPKEVNGEPGWEKDIDDGDLIVTVGGHVGRDGIHGVTESSMDFGDHITAGHVQIADPYVQKKVHDFLIEARDDGYYKFIWDCGGGGLSSAVGETAEFAGGCDLELDRVPLKYEGLAPWEILVSESQERMLLGVAPENYDALVALAEQHDVDVRRIGTYRDHGAFHVTWNDETVAHVDIDWLHDGFPQLELEAEWQPPERSSFDAAPPSDHTDTLKQVLQRPTIASTEWIQRQYDHEVQGTSVLKPLVGEEQDVDSDAAVIAPVRDADKGLALALGNRFQYSRIDPYWMAAASLDEAIRRVLAVGASLDTIVLNDNFCWPNVLHDEADNPDGKGRLAGLVRANRALYRFTTAFDTPCISGKDSMFIQGDVPDADGEYRTVSGLPSLQFAAMGQVETVGRCIDLSLKCEQDLIYVIGATRNDLGATAYADLRETGSGHVPRLEADAALQTYRAVEELIQQDVLQSCHGCYRGGLGVALAKKAFAGHHGVDVDLTNVPGPVERADHLLYSETPGRFVVTVRPEDQERAEQMLDEHDAVYGHIGTVTGETVTVRTEDGSAILDEPVSELKTAWKTPFQEFSREG